MANALTPRFREDFRCVGLMTLRCVLVELPVKAEVLTEDDRVIVRIDRALALTFAVFPAMIKAERSDLFTEPFGEVLPVFDIQREVCWQMLIVIRQRDETVALVHRRLVYTSSRPILGPPQPAAPTLPTRDSDGARDHTWLRVAREAPSDLTEEFQRIKARH